MTEKELENKKEVAEKVSNDASDDAQVSKEETKTTEAQDAAPEPEKPKAEEPVSKEEEKAESETEAVEQADQPEAEAEEKPADAKEVEEPEKETKSSDKPEEAEEAKTIEAPAASEQSDDMPPAEEKEAGKTKEKQSEPVSAHDDFDWDKDEMDERYTKKERSEWEKIYDESLTTVNENELVKGIVVGITEADVVLNIGFKSDGLVPLSEFRDTPDLKVGDETEVYVVKREDLRGQLILSRKNAKLMRAWDNIADAYENDKLVTGQIISKTKGGLIVDVFGLETFLPGSQIDVKPIIDYDAYVGKKMEFKVVKINEAIKNAVVSHKALIESDLEAQRSEIISKLEKGQVLEGIIKNITDFGAFIDLGGVDGLLYITDISWGRINHPSEVLELNQKLNVVVLEFDDEKKRISLGLKQLEPHPWDILDEKLGVDNIVKGKIVNIEDYGAFLEITPGVEGLIHVSEVTWSNQPINAKDYFEIDKEFEAKIVTIDREERKMSLSIKQMTPDPWDDIEQKYPVGSKVKGLVKNITPYGVFIEMDEFIGGMIHISDLSWIKRYNHPTEFCKVGDELEAIVLEIDKENRKIALGHKQIEEDPWDTFENVFPVGSTHEGTIVKRDDKGGIVALQYGLEAFAPAKHLKKEDGSNAEVDEILEFKILEFERDDKRIIVSHSRVAGDKRMEEEDKKEAGKAAQAKKTQAAVKRVNRNVEKTTLGDLGVLGGLKAKMEEEESSDKPAKKAAPKASAKPAATKTVSKKPAAKKPAAKDSAEDDIASTEQLPEEKE